MRRLFIFLFFIIGLTLTNTALALCQWDQAASIQPPAFTTIPLPSSLTVRRVPIGGILASHYHRINNTIGAKCMRGDIMVTSFDNGFEPSTIPKVYKTNVPGIGIRVRASWYLTGFGEYYEFPSQFLYTSDNQSPYLPTAFTVDFIRTEIGVGSGDVNVDFTATLTYPSGNGLTPNPLTYSTTGTVSLKNNFFFSSCESQEPSKTLLMGKIPISNFKSNATPEKNFNLAIRCRGMNPVTPVPVRIYFEGSSKAAGMLNLTGAGQAGVAQGVAIELKNDKGTKLPFNKSGAINLDWQRSEVDAEVYNFAGSARYVASGGEIKPGTADATMTYVLDYN